MKIVFLMNHIIMGGLEKVLLQYLIGLIDLGNTVIVISKEKVVDNYFLSFFAEHNITIIDNIFPKKIILLQQKSADPVCARISLFYRCRVHQLVA